jgi:hypothetical protein
VAVALDASTPVAVYGDTASNVAITTASFTPPSGSIVAAILISGDSGQTHGTPTGLTFTSRVNSGPASNTRVSIWTATGAGSAITVGSGTFAGPSTARGLVVAVFTGAQLAGTPATHSVTGSGAPTDTITTVAANSVVLWVGGDWSQQTGTPTYRSSATQITYKTLTGQYTGYFAYQAAASAGSQTYGVSVPGGQTYNLAAIEIQDSGGGAPAIPPIIVMPPRR